MPGFSQEFIMKKLYALIFGVLFLVLPCVSAMAQEIPPPPCCPHGDPIDGLVGGGPSLLTKLVISNQTLQATGLTRDQLLNAISATFFPDKKADLIIVSKQTVTKPVFVNSTWAVMATEEKIYYRTSRSAITTDYLNAVTEIGLTDGSSWIKISFQNETVNPD
jgi:hypothetical protein